MVENSTGQTAMRQTVGARNRKTLREQAGQPYSEPVAVVPLPARMTITNPLRRYRTCPRVFILLCP